MVAKTLPEKPERKKRSAGSDDSAAQKTKCRERKTKDLKFDASVPGDRGDCEQETLTQGSE